jgi:hypothetical protein
VEYDNENEAEDACEQLNKREIAGQNLNIGKFPRLSPTYFRVEQEIAPLRPNQVQSPCFKKGKRALPQL